MKRPSVYLLGGFLAAAVFVWIYLPPLSRYRELKLKEEEITRELAEVEKKVKLLEEERELLKNDMQYLEKVVRHELGLVKPGEVIYKFVPQEIQEEESELPPIGLAPQ